RGPGHTLALGPAGRARPAGALDFLRAADAGALGHLEVLVGAILGVRIAHGRHVVLRGRGAGAHAPDLHRGRVEILAPLDGELAAFGVLEVARDLHAEAGHAALRETLHALGQVRILPLRRGEGDDVAHLADEGHAAIRLLPHDAGRDGAVLHAHADRDGVGAIVLEAEVEVRVGHHRVEAHADVAARPAVRLA